MPQREPVGAGAELVIDLGECTYLDSTMLGTLHEVVKRAEAVEASLSLQNVPAALADAFQELSMQAVLAHIRDEPLPVPAERERLDVPQPDVQRQRARLLKAHEELAALSLENEAQFGVVVDALRAEGDEG